MNSGHQKIRRGCASAKGFYHSRWWYTYSFVFGWMDESEVLLVTPSAISSPSFIICKTKNPQRLHPEQADTNI